MTDRASKLSHTAESQLSELIDLLSAGDESALRRQCPGRGKLGDGSVAACATHVAGNYGRIASFAAGARESTDEGDLQAGRRRVRRLRRSLGLVARHGPGMHREMSGAANVDRSDLLSELRRRRAELGALAGLTDDQLDSVPLASEEMRFCDGKRTLDQIIRSALKHQGRQVEAIRVALA
jgi:hypothetical protein